MPTPRLLALLFAAAATLSSQPAPVRLPAGVTVQENVPYDTHPQTVMDIYRPAGPGPHPAMIVIHGGGWVAGFKAGMVASWVVRYLEKGFVVANVDPPSAPLPPPPPSKTRSRPPISFSTTPKSTGPIPTASPSPAAAPAAISLSWLA